MKIWTLTIKGSFLASIALFSLNAELSAQVDKVFLMSGHIEEGMIVGDDENSISLQQEGSEIPVVIEKKDIVRINFANGETEQLQFGKLPENTIDWDTKLKMCHNRIAVIPFVYTDTHNKEVNENMSLIIQNDCMADLRRVNDYLKIQALDSTNMLLAEHGIDWLNIRNYSPGDLCYKLGVQFIVYGSVLVSPLAAVEPGDNDSFATENQSLENPQGYRTGASISPKQAETIVDIHMFDIMGETVYTNAQQSFWDTPNAYNINLDYLVDESPFNQRKPEVAPQEEKPAEEK